MTASAEQTVSSGDRIQLPLSFDVEKMEVEIDALNLQEFIYYDVMPLRSPAHLVDPSKPFPPPADNYADGSWTEWLDTSVLKSSPYMASVVDTFRKHTKVTLVRLLRLAPGEVVAEHTDPTLALEEKDSVVRLTIPITTNDAVEFFLNGEPVPMKPGECWYLRLSDPHRVVNAGSTERISLTIDMVPNEWVRSLIAESI
jgi:quercetin dioxygenase-like cupin family protein